MGEQHTKEPWAVGGDDENPDGVPYIEIEAGEIGTRTYKQIVLVQFSLNDEDDFILTDEDRANARRIVACVNFCAGVSTEELEDYVLRNDLRNMLRSQPDDVVVKADK